MRLGALALLLLASTVVSVAAIEVLVGGRTVTIPLPQGFVEATALSKSTREWAESWTPPDNRLLAVYVSEDDAGRIKKKSTPFLQRYMLVQVQRKWEKADVARSDFKQLQASLRESQETLYSQVRDKVDQLMSEKVNIKIGQTLPLGIFSEGEAHTSMSALTKNQVSTASGATEYLVAGGTNVINPADRVLFAYVYTVYEDKADLEWVKDISQTWTQDILAANPRSRSGSLKIGGIDWSRVLEKAIVGAIFGAVLVGIGVLISRRKKKRSSL